MKYETLLEYEKFPLYHSAQTYRAIDLMNSDNLMIPKESGITSQNPTNISFSRDLNHPFYKSGEVIIFTFDRNKLRHNFKLIPTAGDWINVTLDIDPHKELYKYREAEERAVKSIPNFGKYLINIMLPKDMYDLYYLSSQSLTYDLNSSDPWIKPLKAFAAKYKLPIIPKKGLRNESVLEAMLEEDQVFSSWIDDLTYVPDQDAVLMTLLSGRNYMVYDMEEDMFDAWIDAPSQGIFWHEYIRDFHQVM